MSDSEAPTSPIAAKRELSKVPAHALQTMRFSRKASVLVLLLLGALALIAAIECHEAERTMVVDVPWAPSLFYGAFLWLWWAGFIYLLWKAGNRWPFLLQFSSKAAGLQVIFIAAASALHLFVLQGTIPFAVRTWPMLAAAGYASLRYFNLYRGGMEFLLSALAWSACAAAYSHLRAQRTLELEKQLAAAQLSALQMQIEPHFLLNTLNSLTALLELDRKHEALRALENLSAVLKMTLARNTPSKIPLTQELEIVESYLEIERMRFRDRLWVDVHIDPGTLDAMVPCFLLQPIIENAIRHGVSRCEDSGHIETFAKRDGERLQLLVRDNGPSESGSAPGSKTQPGFGIGLSNTRERLVHFYKDDYDLNVHRPQSGGFEVLISIPFERKGA